MLPCQNADLIYWIPHIAYTLLSVGVRKRYGDWGVEVLAPR